MADNELFHAYVVGGARATARAHIELLLKPFSNLKAGSPNYVFSEHVTFTIDNARSLREWQQLSSSDEKKVYVVCTDFITREAENALLKTLEEPVIGTHIFLAVPKPDTLLPTLLSRVRVVSLALDNSESAFDDSAVKKFLSMNVADRLDFVSHLAEKGDDDDAAAQVREKAVSFLDALEKYLSGKLLETGSGELRVKLELILKQKRFLFTSGASVKMILETIALSV